MKPSVFARLMSLRITASALVAVLGLSACADYSGRYPTKGDAKPHAGVIKAQQLPIHGIDVARYQANIDWHAVKAAGTRFAFIKATEGGDYIDPNFQANWAGARAAGVPRGAYHFVYWCRPAHEQAQWFVQHIPNDRDALPPVLDLEWNGHSKSCPHKIDKQLALEKIRLMLRELEQHTGKRPIIYTDITFHRDIMEDQPEFDRYPFWLRSVAAEPHERYSSRRWTFWQYTTTGRVPGIRGDVDRNTFYGSDRDWNDFLATDCDPRDRHILEKSRLCGGTSSRQAYAPATPAKNQSATDTPAAAQTSASTAHGAAPTETRALAPLQVTDQPGAGPVTLDDPLATSTTRQIKPAGVALPVQNNAAKPPALVR